MPKNSGFFAPHQLYPEAYETKNDVMVGLLACSHFYLPSQLESQWPWYK